VSSTLPWSALETGQFSFACSAASWKGASSIPGTAPVTSSADLGIPGTKVTVAETGNSPGRQYAGSVATREELKAEVERIGRDHGHTLGIWLDLGHASQLGCLGCDRYAFVQVLPPPGKAFTEAFEQPCPDRG
jgi:hypothetical protein